MKKILVMLVIILLVIFCSACARKEDAVESSKNEKLSEIHVIEEQEVNSAEESKSNIDNSETQITKPAVSKEKETIIYQGSLTYLDGIVDNNRVVLWGKDEEGQSALHIMEYGSAQSEKVEIKIPQGMMLTNVAVDNRNEIHVLLISEKENNRDYIIYKITNEGEVLESLDISKDMQDISQRGGILSIPEGMAIDGEGNYYFDTLSGTELIRVFNKTGEFLCNITAEGSNIDSNGLYAVESMIRGEDGKIYATLAQAKSSQVRLVTINGANGYLESIAENILPDMHGRYNCIGLGIESDLRIASVGNGVYAYNLGDDKAEEIIPVQDYPCNMESVKMCFLGDGRLMVIDFTTENKIFYYIPMK